jgi:hypothetical protein
MKYKPTKKKSMSPMKALKTKIPKTIAPIKNKTRKNTVPAIRNRRFV